MPLVWAITTDKKVNRMAYASLETFCEWMQLDIAQIDDLISQLEDIGKKKQFKLTLKPIQANYPEDMDLSAILTRCAKFEADPIDLPRSIGW